VVMDVRCTRAAPEWARLLLQLSLRARYCCGLLAPRGVRLRL
jgi:hypothetical protein